MFQLSTMYPYHHDMIVKKLGKEKMSTLCPINIKVLGTTSEKGLNNLRILILCIIFDEYVGWNTF